MSINANRTQIQIDDNPLVQLEEQQTPLDPKKRTLGQRVPDHPVDTDEAFNLFLEWAEDIKLELYTAQIEGAMEIMANQHVILNTPTGSGKSTVALAAHFWALCQNKRSFYTSPIKALVSEKFFDLCNKFGAKNVGMMTGDAAINPNALIICCTQEILSMLALTEGDGASIHIAIVDEFHYYGDRDRGMAWQVPLLALEKTQFLLMSATLGDTGEISKKLEKRTGRSVVLVQSQKRPVPLNFSYSLDPMHEVIPELLKNNKAPIYVVSFSQKECASLANALSAYGSSSKEQKELILNEIKNTKLDSPYGPDVRRLLLSGVGLHHAGLLPKYRLLVEKLAQAGLLKIICGTDTLGVGINIPIRTVYFSSLAKFDGEKKRLLTVRDFKQIAGRAGRKGFDDHGWVVCQAPDFAVENAQIKRKMEANPEKAKKFKLSGPPAGSVTWDEDKYQSLIERPAEVLVPRFSLDYATVINLLQNPMHMQKKGGGYKALLDLIRYSHLGPKEQKKLMGEAKYYFQNLLQAGITELRPHPQGKGKEVFVSDDLQRDFSMHHSLSLYLLYAIGYIPVDDPDYGLKVLSLVESILEDPEFILKKQRNDLKDSRIAELKMDKVPFEEREEILEKENISWPMPEKELIFETFEAYAQKHPWLYAKPVKPKSVVRDMYERCASFRDFVQLYDLKTIEGTFLRYLNQCYKALVQNVPDICKNEQLHDVIAYLRAVIKRTDSSLLEAWIEMAHGSKAAQLLNARLLAQASAVTTKRQDIASNPKEFFARIKAQMHQLLKALVQKDYAEAMEAIIPNEKVPNETILAGLFDRFYREYKELMFHQKARGNQQITITPQGPRHWQVQLVLCDDQDDNMWYIKGEVDLREEKSEEGNLIQILYIGD
jgi:superfamily II RNA helicase